MTLASLFLWKNLCEGPKI